MRLLALIVLLLASPAYAEDEDPWVKGVAKDKQDQANKLYAEGNQLFAEQKHAPALEKYKQALALWNHPIIHYNTAVTMIRLERVLDASDHLDEALRYDAKPFTTPELYRQALDYRILLAKQIGTIEATCSSKEGSILLDGKAWFTCPGTKQMKATTGEHTIVGETTGFATVSRRVLVAAGKTSKETVEMVKLDALVRYEYPTKRWVPWTIAVAGIVIAGIGFAVYTVGDRQLDDYTRALSTECPQGCPEPADLRKDRESAELKGTIAASMFITAGAVATVGVVWGIINRPRRVTPKLEIVPTGGGARAQIGWRF